MRVRESEWVRLHEELFGNEHEARVSEPTLIVAAHPDDEAVSACWMLANAPHVHVAYVTDGAPHDPHLWPAGISGDRQSYAALRRAESELALSAGGVAEESVRRFGFADQEAIERLCEVIEALVTTLRSLEPSVVVTHPHEGGHPDHDATCLAVRASLELLRREGSRVRPRHLEFASYHLHEAAMRTGRFLPHRGGEVMRPLSVVERAMKERMFAAYRSQREVLSLFAMDVERYRAAPATGVSAIAPASFLYPMLGFPVRPERFIELARTTLLSLGLNPEVLP